MVIPDPKLTFGFPRCREHISIHNYIYPPFGLSLFSFFSIPDAHQHVLPSRLYGYLRANEWCNVIAQFWPFPTIICCSCKMAMKPFWFPIHLSARSMNESAVRMLATDSAYLLRMAICSWNFQLKSETLWGFKCFVVTYFVMNLRNNRCLCNRLIYRSWMNTSRIKCM